MKKILFCLSLCSIFASTSAFTQDPEWHQFWGKNPPSLEEAKTIYPLTGYRFEFNRTTDTSKHSLRVFEIAKDSKHINPIHEEILTEQDYSLTKNIYVAATPDPQDNRIHAVQLKLDYIVCGNKLIILNCNFPVAIDIIAHRYHVKIKKMEAKYPVRVRAFNINAINGQLNLRGWHGIANKTIKMGSKADSPNFEGSYTYFGGSFSNKSMSNLGFFLYNASTGIKPD